MKKVNCRRRRRLRIAFGGQALAQETLTVLVGQGLLQVRGRRAVRRDQEVRGQDQRQGRALAISGAGHDPEDRGGARRRHAARRRAMPTSTTSRSPANGPSTAELEDISDVIAPMKDEFLAEHRRDHLPLQRQDQEEGVLRVSAEAADDAHPVLERHAGRRGLQGDRTSRPAWKDVLGVLVRQGAAGATAEDRPAAPIGIGQPMGVDSSDSFYSFLTFMDAYNVKLVDDDGKLLVDDPKVKAGPDQRAQGLHRHPTPTAARRRHRRAGRIPTTTSPSTTRRP